MEKIIGKWWKKACVYQIYTQSFMDTNGDGIGDLKGVIEKLPYIKNLGVNVIWLCPVYKSPMDDGGYDISDYYHIDEMFGTDEDMDNLINIANDMGIKILMDLVVNHTSDEHIWFQKALENPKGKYGKYYIFEETNGEPPNNWRSYFGGSAWERVGNSNTFYLHAFTKKQPDLNWENEEVREEIYKMVNYWLDKGLGGFRIDAICNIKKDMQYGKLEPYDENGFSFIGDWILNKPGIEVFLRELNERTFERHNSMTVAEADVPDELLKTFIGDEGFFKMVFDFSYTDIDVPSTGEWFRPVDFSVKELKEKIYASQERIEKIGWGAVYLENHDQNRSPNKYIPKDDINYYSKTMLAGLFMLLRGTPFIYQGQEIGMENIRMPSIDDHKDIATIGHYKRAMEVGFSKEEAFEFVSKRSRDNSRTPMQWSNSKNAGFSESDTWIKVNENYKYINVEDENNGNTVLNFYRTLINLRNDSAYSDIIVHGSFKAIELGENIISYKRILNDKEILVILNYQSKRQKIIIPNEFLKGKKILNNYQNIMLNKEYILEPYECIVLAN